MAITGIRFVYRIALSTVHRTTPTYIPTGYINIPVDQLADETIRAYNYINDFDLMMYAFGQVNSKAKRIADTIGKRVKDIIIPIDSAVEHIENGQEADKIDYDELVKPRDDYIRSMNLDTLISAYRCANGGLDYCTYEYMTGDKQETAE